MYAYSTYATRRNHRQPYPFFRSNRSRCISGTLVSHLEGYPHLILRQAIKRLAQAVVGAHGQRHSLKEQNSLAQSPKEKKLAHEEKKNYEDKKGSDI